MNHIEAISIEGLASGFAALASAGRQAAPALVAEIRAADRLGDLRAAWNGLLARAATANVFMDPALIAAAHAAEPQTDQRVLLVWSKDAARKLMGVWSFSVGRARRSMLPMSVVRIPAFAHAYLSTPVIDGDCLDGVLDVMLDAIEADRSLANLVTLEAMAADDAVYDALVRVLTQRGTAPCVLERTRRPLLLPGLDGKAYLEQALSGSTRKKLRQHRRKLGERGAVRSEIVSEPDAVRRALEQFLSMEFSGWKGREGTALLCRPADAAFMRGAVGALAEHGCAAIHSVFCGEQPVSMQIVARAGGAAFTWKTAYDETFQDFSPGMLLLEDYTAALLADPGIALVDSCSFDDTGFMTAWTGRRAVADLWIDARRGGSLEFRTLAGLQKSYREMRAAAKAAYRNWRKARKKK